MAKRQRTPEQIEADRARMAKARAARAANQNIEIISNVMEPSEEEVVGAALYVPDSEIKSMLEDIDEDSEVDIYNPLDQGFRVQFSTSAYQPPAMSPSEREVRDKALLPYEKDGGQSVGHAVKFTILPAHKVTRLPGKVAHVAVKQLRNYLIGVEGNKKSMADPVTQRKYEERIIMKIGNSLEAEIVDPGAEIDRKIAELNPR